MDLPERIVAAFASQARAGAELGSPFMARLCPLLPDLLDGPFGARVAGWTGDPRADALVVRVTGGLHALARSGACPALSAAYPPGTADLAAGVRAAMAGHQAFLLPWLDSAPQTNEVARSGVLLGLGLTLAARTGLALDLLEIGASAGLNLIWDRYRYDLGPAGGWGEASPVTIRTEWRGTPPDLATPLRIAARAASDLAPIDVRDRAARERLLAYIWADQAERLDRAAAAMALLAASSVAVARAEAADWVEARLAAPRLPGTVRVLQHSIMWQYLPQPTKDRIRAALGRAGAEAGPDAPLAWARLEADARADSAAILLTTWPGGRTETLGRGDWHGRWAEWGTA